MRLFDSEEDPRLPTSPVNRMLDEVDPGPVEAKYPDPTGAGEP